MINPLSVSVQSDDPHDSVSLMYMARGEELQLDPDEQRRWTGAIVWALIGLALFAELVWAL